MSVTLPRGFYEQDTLTVARQLLGKRLVRDSAEGRVAGLIVETEAYIGPDDLASHARRGLRSPRNEVMYGPPGHAYVYFIYGMYYCLNVVTATVGRPEAVLVRALEPVAGLDLMARRRGLELLTENKVRQLANGPGKLCRALGIGLTLNGADLSGDELYITEHDRPVAFEVATTPRVNVDYAGEWAVRPWRFIIAGNSFVSRPARGSGDVTGRDVLKRARGRGSPAG